MSENKRKRRIVSYLVTGVLLALVGGVMGALKWANRPLLDEPIPPQVLPNPNAADYYKRALELQVDAELIGRSVTTPGPGDPPLPTAAELDAALARNGAALAELRKGLAFPCVFPCERSFSAKFPDYAHSEQLARLLRAEALARAAREDWSGAMDSSLDGLQFGLSVAHGANLLGDLVAIACQAIARRDAWDYADHLSAASCRRAAARLSDLMTHQVPLREVLVQEKWMLLGSVVKVLDEPHWAEHFVGGVSPAKSAADKARMALRGRRAVVHELQAGYAWAIGLAERTYGESLVAPRPRFGTPTDELLPVLAKAAHRHYFGEAENGLLLVTLTLRAFKLEHGAHPDRLDRLVPEYLPRIPRDPYAASGPLSYRRDAAKYVLWSIGPDAHDDGGKAIDNPGEAGSKRRLVQFESKGDIVAGVNP
ncbi:MAG: hypothetical protein HYU66_19825 [Armatimonadetes bacterium]|nr:hypothetical protein [Armatimonadota bacterium]